MPKTSARVPKTSARVPKTSARVPKTSARVPKTSARVPRTSARVPKAIFGLFTDAEAAENDAEQVFGIDAAGDFAERVEGFAQINRGEFGVVGEVV